MVKKSVKFYRNLSIAPKKAVVLATAGLSNDALAAMPSTSALKQGESYRVTVGVQSKSQKYNVYQKSFQSLLEANSLRRRHIRSRQPSLF